MSQTMFALRAPGMAQPLPPQAPGSKPPRPPEASPNEPDPPAPPGTIPTPVLPGVDPQQTPGIDR